MRMNTKRVFYIMTAMTIMLCLGIIGIVYAGNSLLTKKSTELSDIKTQEQVIENQKVSLIKAKSDIEKYTELNEISKTIVPQDKDQAKTIREINKIAKESEITLSQISFETSTLGEKPAPAPKSDGESSAPTTPSTNSSVSQVKPVVGINGVYSLEINVDSGSPVPYYQFLNFLENLENNRRTAHVSKIAVNPNADGTNVSFSLTINAYIKP